MKQQLEQVQKTVTAQQQRERTRHKFDDERSEGTVSIQAVHKTSELAEDTDLEGSQEGVEGRCSEHLHPEVFGVFLGFFV